MKNFSILSYILIFLVLLLPNGCSKKKAPLSTKGSVYTAKKTVKAPEIDGILNDPCWKDLETINLVSVIDGTKPKLPTTVRAIWDDKYLYIGFECQDSDAESTLLQPDGDISAGDYCGILFNAMSDTTTYCKIEIAPTGVVYDAFVVSGRGDINPKVLTSWNCENTRASVSVYGGGPMPGTSDRFWTVEIAIPLKECLPAKNIPPVTGDTWKVNFVRYDKTGGEMWMAFNPTGGKYFDAPASFAWLKFSN